MKNKKVLVIGISGFVGEAIATHFVLNKYRVTGLCRSPQSLYPESYKGIRLEYWDGLSSDSLAEYIKNAGTVINMTGENIGTGLWTAQKKMAILQSRITVSEALARAVLQLPEKQRPVVVQASAVGYYGSRGDEELDEQSSKGSGFLSDVVETWERTLDPLIEAGVRIVILRLGVVWAIHGGALPKMIRPFQKNLGGSLGNGRQYMSWINYKDLGPAVEFILRKDHLDGIFNVTSPFPIRNREFAETVGKLMGKPSWLAVPAWLLRCILREFADEVALASQRAVPRRLLREGFEFTYPEISLALRSLIGSRRKR